ncbi:acetoacetate--CoA ligase [Saccharopolyspora spinosa]|uniref:Acetoacetyl-CoA synthetase n=1 Tax=Saccharopolyspora spinosa TaxID=60894 RepID=A0A2N3Y1P5_SACSN|nr:acetoacetate--CoA ligase [Saccharopolyspora spinosa]PKW16864.1 acetoacetyl-CoA synthetase [Saccharopolyspora spinosa]
MTAPRVLWEPTPDSIAGTRLHRFAAWVSGRRGITLGDPTDYDAVWRWSVDHLDEFWADLAVWAGLLTEPPGPALANSDMPGAVWFPDVRLNFAEQALKNGGDRHPALVVVDENLETFEVAWASLRAQVGAFADTLRRLGVRRGDRVAGYLPNGSEAVVAFLGTAALGAVWTVCASDFGPSAVLARLAQVEPVVLVAADGYRFNGKEYDRREQIAEIRAALPTLRATIIVPVLHPADDRDGTTPWCAAVANEQEPRFEPLPFDHPLWIVYSSGTTGLPKGIVHGHGGITLEQWKQGALHNDIGPGDRFYWYASTAWIMWNIATSALLSGATVVVHNGSPSYPSLDMQFAVAEKTGITYLGTSAGYLTACEKAELRPRDRFDLSALRTIGSTGSPLPASTFEWVYRSVKSDVFLSSSSGGTDIASGFIGGSTLLPVVAGELQRPMLGVFVESWNDSGQPVVGELGELVVTKPMPSMPLRLWGDDDGERYRATYFEPWPGVWRHGDWLEITDRGTCQIMGRSDSTLNRGGVRMGTAEIYAAVDTMPEISDSLVLGVEQPDGTYYMPLFVQLAGGAELSGALVAAIRDAIRAKASPRHVPDEVIAVPGIPRTRTGKRIEVPLKRLFQGVAPEKALNATSLDNPATLATFVELADNRPTSWRKPR